MRRRTNRILKQGCPESKQRHGLIRPGQDPTMALAGAAGVGDPGVAGLRKAVTRHGGVRTLNQRVM